MKEDNDHGPGPKPGGDAGLGARQLGGSVAFERGCVLGQSLQRYGDPDALGDHETWGPGSLAEYIGTK